MGNSQKVFNAVNVAARIIPGNKLILAMTDAVVSLVAPVMSSQNSRTMCWNLALEIYTMLKILVFHLLYSVTDERKVVLNLYVVAITIVI